MHVFYTHSHITFLISYLIIKKLNLNKFNCVFIFGRNYVPCIEIEYDSILLNNNEYDLAKKPAFGEPLLKLNKFFTCYNLDKKISKLTKRKKFNLYLPSTKNFLMHFVATHKNCLSVSIIEEGLLLFTNNFLKIRKNNQLSIFKNIFFLNYNRLYNSNLKHKIYCISNDIINIHRKSNYNIELLNIDQLPINNNFKIYNYEKILIFDSIDFLESNLNSILNKISFLDLKKIHFKLHPDNITQSDKIINYFKLNKHNEIDKNISIELLFFNCSGLEIIGFHSSLLYYATIFNHKSFRIEDETDIGIIMPSLFFEKVKKIQYESKNISNNASI